MKKITSLQDYYELERIVYEAQDALNGASCTGLHYNLAFILRGFGLMAVTRDESVRLGKRLLKEYEKENFQ